MVIVATGDSFKEAFYELEKLVVAILVHGSIKNVAGEIVKHAWVENGEVIIDFGFVKGGPYHCSILKINADKKRYYRLCADGEKTYYDLDQARYLHSKHKTFGPWPEDTI